MKVQMLAPPSNDDRLHCCSTAHTVGRSQVLYICCSFVTIRHDLQYGVCSSKTDSCSRQSLGKQEVRSSDHPPSRFNGNSLRRIPRGLDQAKVQSRRSMQ